MNFRKIVAADAEVKVATNDPEMGRLLQKRGGAVLEQICELYRRGDRSRLESISARASDWRNREVASLLLDAMDERSPDDITARLYRLCPWISLHQHLDGSLPPEIILGLAKANGIDLSQRSGQVPKGYSLSHIQNAVVMTDSPPDPDHFTYHFGEWLADRFALSIAVMQTSEAIETAAYHAAKAAYQHGLLHCEWILAPALHVSHEVPIQPAYDAVTEAVRAGFQRAYKHFGISAAVRLAVYRNLVDVPRFNTHPMDTAQAAVRANMKWGSDTPMGIDFVGKELAYPLREPPFSAVLDYARGQALPIIAAHVGESPGSGRSVHDAVTRGVRRIGNGHNVMRVKFDRPLSEVFNGVTFEVCPISSVLTGTFVSAKGKAGRLRNHPVLAMDDAGLWVTVNADNPVVLDYPHPRVIESLAVLGPRLTGTAAAFPAPPVHQWTYNALFSSMLSHERIDELKNEMDKIFRVVGFLATLFLPPVNGASHNDTELSPEESLSLR